MHLQFKPENGKVILVLKGQLNRDSGAILYRTLYQVLEQAQIYSDWIFDLSKLEICDSTGIGHLFESLKKLMGAGASIKLAALAPSSHKLLKTSRFHFVFPCYPSLAAAIGS